METVAIGDKLVDDLSDVDDASSNPDDTEENLEKEYEKQFGVTPEE